MPKPVRSVGPDENYAGILKEARAILTKISTSLLENCLDFGVFSTSREKEKTRITFKKGIDIN